jgi:hypothetical protein
MAVDPDRLRAEQQANELLAMYQRAQDTIAGQIARAIAIGDLRTASRRQLQLAATLRVLEQLGVHTDPAARALVADAYKEGSEKTLSILRELQIGGVQAPTFTGVSAEAVQVMQDAILGRLQESRRIVGRTVDDVYARAGRRAAMQSLLGAAGSPRSAQADMAAELMKNRDVARMVKTGGHGFVDRAGKRWALHTYAEMATRTIIREAAVQGAVNRMAAHGVNLARVSVHANSCQICAPYQGRLVSLDGSTGDYEGEAVTNLGDLPNGGPPMHPRCRHSLQPVAVRIQSLRRELQGIIK